MKTFKIVLTVLSVFFLIATQGVFAANKKAETLTCVGLFSETDAGQISYQVGAKGPWIVIKLGDVIPADATVKLSVEQDWVEFTPTSDPNLVFDLQAGPKESQVKVTDILKGKGRAVAFPVKGKADPKFANKLVVKQILGRQIYAASPDADEKDLQYGDIIGPKGIVRIIGINNLLTLAYPDGSSATIIGPLKFEVERVSKRENIYKFLNVAK